MLRPLFILLYWFVPLLAVGQEMGVYDPDKDLFPYKTHDISLRPRASRYTGLEYALFFRRSEWRNWWGIGLGYQIPEYSGYPDYIPEKGSRRDARPVLSLEGGYRAMETEHWGLSLMGQLRLSGGEYRRTVRIGPYLVDRSTGDYYAQLSLGAAVEMQWRFSKRIWLSVAPGVALVSGRPQYVNHSRVTWFMADQSFQFGFHFRI